MSRLSGKGENNYFETSIILIKGLQRQDKLLKINHAFVKIKQQDLLYDNKIISDSIAYFTRIYVIYIIFPRTSQFDL